MLEQTDTNSVVFTRDLASAIEDLDLSKNTYRSTTHLDGEYISRLQLAIGMSVTRFKKGPGNFESQMATTLLISLTRFFKILEKDLSILETAIVTAAELKGHKAAIDDHILELSPQLSKIKPNVEYVFAMNVFYSTSKIKQYQFVLAQDAGGKFKNPIFNQTVNLQS